MSLASMGGLSTAVSPLLFLEQGRLPPQSRQEVEFHSENGSLHLRINDGSVREDDTPGQSQPELGYTVIRRDDPRIAHRRTDRECYTFALSDDPTWEPKFPPNDRREYLDIVERDYRLVDLKHESAKIGDVVVYLQMISPDLEHPSKLGFEREGRIIPSSLDSPHMGVVSQVDKNGQPTHAIGKFGHGIQPIYEHPMDQAILRYGHLYVIVRKNPQTPGKFN